MASKTYNIVINAQTRNAVNGIAGVATSLRALGAIGFAAAVAKGFQTIATASIDASRQFQNYRNSLALITDGNAELQQTMAKLTVAAKQNRTSFAETVDLYTKLTLSTRDLGISADRVLTVTNKFSRALAISGADAGTAAGAIRQFGQAMGSGQVRGDELNSIIEALGPALAIMSQESGLTVNELRKLAEAGQLTSERFFKMIEDSTALNEAFGKTRTTIDQLETAFSDSFARAIASTTLAAEVTRAYELALRNTTRMLDDFSGATEEMVQAQIDQALASREATASVDTTAQAIASYEKLLASATATSKKFQNVSVGTPLERAQSRLMELENAMANYVEATNQGATGNGTSSETFMNLSRSIRGTKEEIERLEKAEADRTARDAKRKADELAREAELLANRQQTFIDMQRMQAAEAAGTGYIEEAQQQYNNTVREAREIFTNQVDLQRVLQNAELERIRMVQEGTKAANELAQQQRLQELEDFVNAERKKRDEAILTEQVRQMQMGKTAEQARTYAEFQMKSDQEKAEFAIAQGKDAFQALGQYNKTAFAAYKAFAIGQAIMNTYTGATKALASYPPPFNFIAAAAVVASGLAQVAQIRSQQFSGRQFGGPVTGGGSYIVGERGPEVFTPQGNGMITPNNQLGMGGGANITFNIDATDAEGFDDLLIQRKPLIVGMVQEAMSRQGSTLR